MRRLLAAAWLLLLAGPSAAMQGDPSPRIVVERPILDLGRAVRGQTAEGTFVVRNLGGAPLHLQSVKPSCSCTVASYDEVILPGQAGRITAKLETKDFRGPVDRGITVTTDDPDQPMVSLWLHVDVAGSVLLLPRPTLDLRPANPEVSPVARLLVRQDPGEKGEMRLSEVSVDAPWLRVATRRVEAVEPESAGLPEARPGDVVFEVGAVGEVPEGHHKQTLRFDTGLPTEPHVEVPVGVFLPARLRVAADQVHFGPPEPDGTRRAVVLVSVREDMGEGSLVIEGPQGLQSKLEPAGSRRYHVRLAWTARGEPSGAVVFRAGSASKSLPIVSDSVAH